MVKRPIRDLNSSSRVPPRFCDVVVSDDEVFLEFKTKNEYKTILWEHVVHQVDLAKREYRKKLPQSAS